MDFPVKFVTLPASSAKIECARFGRGAKALVIFPGLFVKSLMPLAGAVAERYKKFLDAYQIFLMERPQEPPSDCDTDFLARAEIEALDALSVRDAFVVGISAGGMVAQKIAAARPDLVKKLFLGSTAAKTSEKAAAIFKRWAQLGEQNKAAELYQDFAAAVYSADFYNKYKDAILASLDGATADDLKCFTIFARGIAGFDASALLPKIKCPILAVGAEQDKIFGADAASQIASLAGGGAQSFTYKNYGHAVYDEAPDYPDRILEFFAE